jgi:ATP-dependent DNA helicase PIF1
MNTSSFQEVLELKVGAVVMCTVNLDMDNGICNGSQGIITSIDETALGNYPVVKFTNGVERTITPHYIQSEEYPSVSVGQVPLCLAWAMTIHKIQGATLAMASIDVGGQIFEYGQTYVALSRVQSLDGLYLSAFNSYKIRANQQVIRFYASLPELDYKIEDDPFEKFSYKEDELREEEYVDPTIKRVRL